MRWMACLAVAWVGCSNAAPPATSPADLAGGDMAEAGGLPLAPGQVCSPSAKFCGQGEIRTCSADGMSSTSTTTCMGSTSNPGACDGAGGAHCALTYAACAWFTSIPWSSQGQNMGTPAPSGADWCTTTSTSSTIAFAFKHGTSTAAFSAAAGGFMNPAVDMGPQSYSINTATFTVDGCSNPSGSFTVEGALPHWNIVIQTTCNGAQFSGQFSGAI